MSTIDDPVRIGARLRLRDDRLLWGPNLTFGTKRTEIEFASHYLRLPVVQDLTSGQGAHVGRFLRDPVTKQVEQLQVIGRLARRQHPPTMPEARSPADSLRWV